MLQKKIISVSSLGSLPPKSLIGVAASTAIVVHQLLLFLYILLYLFLPGRWDPCNSMNVSSEISSATTPICFFCSPHFTSMAKWLQIMVSRTCAISISRAKNVLITEISTLQMNILPCICDKPFPVLLKSDEHNRVRRNAPYAGSQHQANYADAMAVDGGHMLGGADAV